MATGEKIWAQAWSEPEAGSDLASLRSTAVRDEERGGWVLNGQKTWSSRATYAHWGFGLFRSDPEAERHRGLTYFVFPLDAEGLTVRPIAQLDGEPVLVGDVAGAAVHDLERGMDLIVERVVGGHEPAARDPDGREARITGDVF